MVCRLHNYFCCHDFLYHQLAGLDTSLKRRRGWNYLHRLLPSLVLHPIQRRPISIHDLGRLVIHTDRHQRRDSRSSRQRPRDYPNPRPSRTGHHRLRYSRSPSAGHHIRRSPRPDHRLNRDLRSHYPCPFGRDLHRCRLPAEAGRSPPRRPRRPHRSRISLIPVGLAKLYCAASHDTHCDVS